MLTPAISLEMPSSRSVTWRVQPPRSSRMCDAENGNFRFATVPWSVGGGDEDVGVLHFDRDVARPGIGAAPARPHRLRRAPLPGRCLRVG